MNTFKVYFDFMITLVKRNIHVSVSWLTLEPTGSYGTFDTLEKGNVASRAFVLAYINCVAMHAFLVDHKMCLHCESEINEIINVLTCHRISDFEPSAAESWRPSLQELI